MSLPGLPPLPKSLSGLELAHQNNSSNLFAIESQRTIPTMATSRKPSTLDTQLAILRREMVSEITCRVRIVRDLSINLSLSDLR